VALALAAAAGCDLGAPPTRYAVAPGYLAGAGDVDGDGAPDLVTAGDDTAFGVLTGDGSGDFAPVTTIPHVTPCVPGDPGMTCTNVRVGQLVDLNEDGLLDAVVSYHLSMPQWGYEVDQTEVRMADGAGRFGAPISVPAGAYGDVTGDGHLDRVTTSDPFAGPWTLLVSPGDGQGTFGPTVVSDLSGLGLRVGAARLHDVDGDGLGDVVLDGVCISGEGESWLRGCLDVLRSDGSGAFAASTRMMAADTRVDDFAASMADVDDDGDADIVATATGHDVDGAAAVGAVYVYLGDGTGGFGPEIVSPATTQTVAAKLGDFDGDGLTDLLTRVDNGNGNPTDDYARVLFGDGTGAFPERHVLGTNGYGTVADLDLDGRSDYVTSTADQVSVYMNRWTGRPD
jgi:FG-GAP-like repeat